MELGRIRRNLAKQIQEGGWVLPCGVSWKLKPPDWLPWPRLARQVVLRHSDALSGRPTLSPQPLERSVASVHLGPLTVPLLLVTLDVDEPALALRAER